MVSSRKEAVESLFERLDGLDVLSAHKYQVSINEHGDLLVCRRGHWRGLWRHTAGIFGWIVAGSRDPFYETGDVDEAVAYTIQYIVVE